MKELRIVEEVSEEIPEKTPRGIIEGISLETTL